MEFKVMTFSLAIHVLDQLHKYCDRTGQKPTDVIRQAVYEFLNIIEHKSDTDESDSNE